jgi:hypothetical protein
LAVGTEGNEAGMAFVVVVLQLHELRVSSQKPTRWVGYRVQCTRWAGYRYFNFIGFELPHKIPTRWVGYRVLCTRWVGYRAVHPMAGYSCRHRLRSHLLLLFSLLARERIVSATDRVCQ